MSLLIVAVVRIVVGGLLLVAGIGKLTIGSSQRIKWLRAYRLMPAAALPAASLALPAAEVLSGGALITGFGGRISLGVAAAVLIFLTLASALTLARGLRPDCGCFGRWARQQLSWTVVARNLALITLLAAVSIAVRPQPQIPALTAGVAVLAAAGFTIAITRLPARGLAVAGVQPRRAAES